MSIDQLPSVARVLELEKPETRFWFVYPDEIEDVLRSSTIKPVNLVGRQSSTGLVVGAETKPANSPNRVNEDCKLVIPMGEGRELVAALDGATSQLPIADLVERGVNGAYYISHLTAIKFPNSEEHKDLSQKADLTAADVMREVNMWLYGRLRKVGGVDYQNVLTVPGMAATFCLIDAVKSEITIAHVADTFALAVYPEQIELLTFNQNEKYDKENIKYIRDLSHERGLTLRQGLRIEEIKQKKHERMCLSFKEKINTPDGCGILNGMPELVSNGLIYEKTIPITPDLKSVILGSDGALLPYQKENLTDETIFKNLVKDTKSHKVGINFGFTERGESILLQDPGYEKIPRFKDDDATIIEVDFIKNA